MSHYGRLSIPARSLMPNGEWDDFGFIPVALNDALVIYMLAKIPEGVPGVPYEQDALHLADTSPETFEIEFHARHRIVNSFKTHLSPFGGEELVFWVNEEVKVENGNFFSPCLTAGISQEGKHFSEMTDEELVIFLKPIVEAMKNWEATIPELV